MNRVGRCFPLFGYRSTGSVTVLVLLLAFSVPSHGQEVLKVADVPYPLSVSSDGRFVAEIGSQGNLAVRDLNTGERVNVTESTYPELVMNAAFSPRGDHVAFAWHNEDDHDDLRVIGRDGSNLRVLYRDPSVRSVWVKGWSPEGDILVTLQKMNGTGEIALVSGEDGRPHVLAAVDTRRQELPNKMAFSPDGRFIAYDAPNDLPRTDHDLQLLTKDGLPGRPLTENAADDRLLGWSPSGEGIVFASDRSGSVDIWLQPIFGGEPQGNPNVLMRDVGQMIPLGFVQGGTYYFKVMQCDCHVYVADLEPRTGQLVGTPQIVDSAFHNTGAFWSPDGEHLAYIGPRDGVTPNSWDLVVRALGSGDEKRIPVDVNVLHQIRPIWSPEGGTVLVEGWDRSAYPREVVLGIDSRTGSIATLLSSSSVWDRLLDWPVWAPDGSALYYTDQAADTTTGIFRKDLDSGREEVVLQNTPPPFYYGLSPSPDGRDLAFGVYDHVKRTSGLAVLDLGSRELRELAEVALPSLMGLPAWFPDSEHLLYHVGDQLWKVSKDTGEASALGKLPSPGYNRAGASIHPNGLRMTFVAEHDRSSEIRMIRGLF
jgi:Tol biopolymer transport system component